jgi:RNA polymerase sigma-70 factor (ECF subfamily)
MITDGGGKRPSALRPMIGREDVMSLLRGLAWRQAWPLGGEPAMVRINSLPGVVLNDGGGLTIIAFEPDGEGRLAAIYVMRNPEKLTHLAGAARPGQPG